MDRFRVLIEHAVGLSSSPRSYRGGNLLYYSYYPAPRADEQIYEYDNVAVLAEWFNSTRHPEAASLSSQWPSEPSARARATYDNGIL